MCENTSSAVQYGERTFWSADWRSARIRWVRPYFIISNGSRSGKLALRSSATQILVRLRFTGTRKSRRCFSACGGGIPAIQIIQPWHRSSTKRSYHLHPMPVPTCLEKHNLEIYGAMLRDVMRGGMIARKQMTLATSRGWPTRLTRITNEFI